MNRRDDHKYHHRNNCRVRKCAGFTLVELMVVVAVIGILVAIAVPIYTSNTEAARIATDQANLRILNSTTLQYAIANNKTGPDIFDGISTDYDRMDRLIDQGFLTDAPRPQKKEASFNWSIEHQRWLYSASVIGEAPLPQYIFSGMSKDDFIFSTWDEVGGGSTWSINEEGLYVTGAGNNDMLFFGNNKSEYTLNTRFQLKENAGQVGGLGIFFETLLNGENHYRDTGYILQFDRGFSEIVLRRRVNGYESSNQGGEILFRIGNESTSTIKNENIPFKTNNAWWESEKEISLSVKDSPTPGKKLLTVSLDGDVLLTDFEIESDIEPLNNHTGFRAWNNQPATIYDMTVK